MTRRVAVMLMAGASAFAQRDRFWWREPLGRVRADIDRAERNLHYLPAEEFERFNAARREIGEFQRRWEEGRYDKGALDHVIENLNHVVEHGRLRPHDRDILSSDVGRLREMREHWDREHR